MLAAADRAFAEARTVGRGLAGTVRVGVTPAVGAGVRAEVGARAARRRGRALGRRARGPPRDVAQALRDRDVELVLGRTAPRAAEVDSAALRPTPAALFVPAGHRLAGDAPVRWPRSTASAC